MKTLYKIILTFTLLIIISQSFSTSTHASTEKVSTSTMTINHVSYDYRFGGYIAISNEDEYGNVWVIDIVQNKPYKQSSMEWLNNKYTGKKIKIEYIDVNNDEAEILKVEWVE